MEEITKVHVDWKKIAVVGLLVVLTGLVSAGSTWYVLDWSKNAELEVKEEEISTLETKVEQLQENINGGDEKEATTTGTKTFSDGKYGLSFEYSNQFTVTDKTATWVGSDENQFPWYSRSDLVKLALSLISDDSIQAKLVLNSDELEKIKGVMGGTGIVDKEYTVNGYKTYRIKNYGQASGATGIEYILQGKTYAFIIYTPNNSLDTAIEELLETVKLK